MKHMKRWLRVMIFVLAFSLVFSSTVLADGETGTVGWESLAQFKTGTLDDEPYNVYAGTLYLDMTTGERVPVFCTDILHHVNNGKAFYASDEEMDCRITWLLQNYPPVLQNDYSASDVPGSLSDWKREMGARQAAVWYFSDGYNPIGAGESTDPNNWDIALRAMEIIDSVPDEAAACALLAPDVSLSPTSVVNLQGEPQTFTVNLTQGGEPIAGAAVALSATAGELSTDMVTTDEAGTATFTLVMDSAGSAEVVASTTRPLYVGTIFLGKDSANYQKLVLGKDTSGLVFGTAAATWQGTGSITAISFSDYNMNGIHEDGEPLLKSWSISLKGPGVAKTAKTDEQGKVTFSSLGDGDYTVKETVQNGWLATTPTSYDVTVAGDAHTVYFGQIKLPVIIGQKYEDINLNGEWDDAETALPGWELQLFREDGSAVIGMKGETDAEGQVIFSSDRNPTDLLPGTYVIRETLKDGWLPTDGLSKTFSVKATDVLEVAIGNTILSDVCMQSGECFEIEYFGYQDNPDGTTTITFKVTDICKYDVSYIAFGTNGWTRVAPPAGSYDGELGNYNVVWTNENGNPGFTSVKFETKFDGYSEGASDIFELVVDGFDPDEPMLIQGHAGRGQEVEQYIFSLNNLACVPVVNPDLSLTKVASAEEVFVGEQVTYTLEVTNEGPENAQEYEDQDVRLTDTLPEGMTFVSAEPSQGTCEYLEDAREVSCDLGAINYSKSASVEVVAIINTAGELINTAALTVNNPSDPNPDNNTATATVTGLELCPDPDATRDLSARIVQNPENPLEWWGIVTNKSDVCVYDVGMASYKKFDNVLNHQELFDSDESYEIGPGETVLTVVAPDCGTQLDVFFSAKHLGEGPEYDMVPLVLPEFGREDLYGPYGTRYGPRLLAAKHIGEDDFCELDPGLCSFNSMTIEGIEDGQYLSGVVNVRALFDNVVPAKVQFNLVGPTSKTHVENIDPYYFLGDTNQQPNGWDTDTYPAGTYTMTITAYEEWWPCVTQEFALHIVGDLNPAIDIEAEGPAEAHEGDEVTYEVTVSNTGDATLDVVVPLPDGTEWTGTLEPGTSTTFTTTTTVPDGADDPYEETFTATGTDTLGEEVTDSDTVSTDILKPGIDIEADGPAEVHEGDEVTYDVTVTNTGDATLDVVVPLPDGTEWTGTLEPGASTTFTTTTTVADGAAEPYEETFIATGTDSLGGEVSDSDTVSSDVLKPAIVVKADGPALAHEGDELTYQVIVMNTGDTALDVVVPLPDGTEWTGTIEPDGSASFSTTDTVPDGADDPYEQTFTATGTDSLGAEVSSSDVVSTDILKPAIAIVKRANAESVYEGAGVTYSYRVTNVGEDPLFNVIVRDDKCTPVSFVDGDTDGDGLLDTDETWNYICSATLFETTTNTATAYGADELGLKVVASAQATVVVMPLNPAISITKEADQEIPAGSSAVFTITVANTGDVDLTGVTVVDELAPDCDRSFDLLAVGASESFTCVVADVTEDFVNTATATGTPPLGEDVSATDTAAVTVIADEPLTIEVIKMAGVEMLDEPGGLASFTVEVLNPNREVTLISLIDDPYGDVADSENSALVETSCETGVTIPAGGSYTCSFTVEILGEPGDYFDSVTAVVEDVRGNTAEATDEAMVVIADILPSVDVELDVTPTVVPVPSEEGPELVMYTGKVTNTSDEIVTLVSLYDPWDESGEDLVCYAEDGCAVGMELEPGQTCDCSFQGEIYGEAGDVITRWLKAVVEDNDGNSATDEDDASVTIEDSGTEPEVESITLNKVWWNTAGMEVDPPADLGDFQIVATSDLGQAICSYVDYDDYVELVCEYDNVEPYNQPPYGNDALWILLDEYGYGYYTVEELNIPEGWEADEIGLGEQVYIRGESPSEHLVNNFQLPGTVSYSMELTKTVNLAEAGPEDTLLYDITLENTGTGSLTDVEIYDFLPGSQMVTYVPGSATCTGCDFAPVYGEDTLRAYVAILEPGESLMLSFPVQINSDVEDGTIIENTARGSSSEASVVQAFVQTNVVVEPVGDVPPGPLDDDGEPGYVDADGDGDGIPDADEGTGDLDGDGVPNYLDTDADGDGILDKDEGAGDVDDDGIPNYLDTDADGDGIPDADEGTDDLDGDGVPNYLDTDADGDGILDSDEGAGDMDGDGVPNYLDTDADGDGIPDAEEGTGDVDGDGMPNYLDTDADGDGISDVVEGTGDLDGDGLPNYLDTDADGDGIPDSYEGTGDADGDGLPNYLDTDSDGDGIPDAEEGTGDADGDGLLDYLDTDADGDTVPDAVEGTGDTDADGIPDYLDTDDDGDGILTRNEDVNGDGDPTNDDSDGDGVPNYLDSDDDGDGILTSAEDIDGDGDPTNDDSDGDGVPNYLDSDDDGDGIPTALEDGNGDGDPTNDDADGDGLPNYLDPDSDGDGLLDSEEWSTGADDPLAGCTADDPVCVDNDADGDGVPNYLDLDSDGDGLADGEEGMGDADGDGVPDWLDPDPTVTSGGDDYGPYWVFLPWLRR